MLFIWCDVIGRMPRFDYSCVLTWNLLHLVNKSFWLSVYIILALWACKFLMIILGLLNKLHFRKNYDNELQRLLHRKEQTSYVWFQLTHLCKPWSEKLLQEMFSLYGDTRNIVFHILGSTPPNKCHCFSEETICIIGLRPKTDASRDLPDFLIFYAHHLLFHKLKSNTGS